ncbi:hypothetical protein [Brevibacterium picturae]|uniref:Uncharacterized protein n=1 Tax=Brevibacterium picturae TaxID=260553 RepID=A0ABP4MXK4_9MICO
MIDNRNQADRLDETFDSLIPREVIPANLHSLYDAYEDWTDKAEAAQFEASRASVLIEAAKAQDIAEAEAALVAGESHKGTPNQDQAEATAKDTVMQYRVAQRQQRQAARALLAGLRDHEAEITEAVRKKVTPLLQEYEQFLRDADEKSRALTNKIDQAASSIRFVEELRSGETKNLEIGMNYVSVPSFSSAHEANNKLEDQLEALTQTAVSNYVHVVGNNGVVMKMPNNDSIRSLISGGHMRRATSKEVATLEG